MEPKHQQLLRDAAARGKYAPLYHYLSSMRVRNEWRTTFGELEAILGFKLPVSARLHRPWWANPKKGNGHSHALAWQSAGWRTTRVDVEAETLIFAKAGTAAETDETQLAMRKLPFTKVLPPHDPGPWPDGTTLSREEMYDDMGHLTGGPRSD